MDGDRFYTYICTAQDNWTLLLIAAKNGHAKVTETLIGFGADVQAGNMVG